MNVLQGPVDPAEAETRTFHEALRAYRQYRKDTGKKQDNGNFSTSVPKSIEWSKWSSPRIVGTEIRQAPMIFRLSQRLAKKIKVVPTAVTPPDPNLFIDWSAHLFTADRTQYIILTNTASLYSTIMLGRGAANRKQFHDKAVSCIQEFMAFDGLSFLFEKFIAPALGDVVFSKALNRSVTGSMNDLVYHGKMWMLEAGLSPFDASLKLDDMPMSALSYRNPRETFKRLAP